LAKGTTSADSISTFSGFCSFIADLLLYGQPFAGRNEKALHNLQVSAAPIPS
jgi:hypothetical protein